MWNPPVALSPEEQKIAARTRKARKFFVFLRERRHELLDADLQNALATSYSPGPGGKAPVEAGLLALATLLQAYCNVGDRDAVELTVMDKRWQRVLDCLGTEQPPFSQGTLLNFRMRLIAHDLDKVLLERTVALAEQTGGFGARQLRQGAGLHASVWRRPGGGHAQPARPCTAQGGGARGSGVGQVRRGHRGGRRAGTGGTEQSQSRLRPRLGRAESQGAGAAPGAGGSGSLEAMAGATSHP